MSAPGSVPVDGPPRFVRERDRFEMKYWLSPEEAADVVRRAGSYVTPDRLAMAGAPYRGGEVPVGQCINSLYLETRDFTFFRQHVEAALDRFKLRVRAYGDPPAGTAFFETKRKVKQVTVKGRAGVPIELVPSLLDGSWDQLPSLGSSSRQALGNFLYLQTVYQAAPLLLVRFYREAFTSLNPADDIRVTFDRGICAQGALGASFAFDPRAWIPIDGEPQHGRLGPQVLLELKFPRIAPFWMRQIVERLEMRRIAYSKYVSAARCLFERRQLDDPLLDAVPVGAL